MYKSNTNFTIENSYFKNNFPNNFPTNNITINKNE